MGRKNGVLGIGGSNGVCLSRRTLVALGLGQFLSLLITSTGFSSSQLSRRGINAPTSQSFLNYVLLAVVYGGIMIHRQRGLLAKWYYYLMLAVVDVEANYLGGSHPVKGDMLVIGGSMLYAISNVGEEFFVKNIDRVELMAMLGTFGAVVSACQISILERQELQSIKWTAAAVLPFLGFSLAMFLFYSSVPLLLKISGATMLNLSLLTSDMWAVVIRIFAYNEKVDWLYFVAFGAVAVGLLIYSWESKKDETLGEVNEAAIEDEEARIENLDQGGVTPTVARRGPYHALVMEQS
ncbi:solute carrier family 35 member F2 isoform X3 [Amborella trichopoda]|uniref:solute carrier family 35 member F2 isoform X3 n=1 Tax=Amborella trichopoda TaxID=13333 RepID=UPI0009BD3FF6|nr:solute carrier family 35 member F2 isoform X3 [Amborella trichopoda]|eukprot:XP_020531928.1 solute carrier family 35 member F2 isoform X3 [Amborella trichopoda]